LGCAGVIVRRPDGILPGGGGSAPDWLPNGGGDKQAYYWQGIRLMGRVVALMDDIFFQMKVAETAKHLDLEFKVATNVDALLGLLEPRPQLVIVDLNARSQPIAAIEKLRAAAPEVRVVAFLSHVQRELAEQAKNAGCEEVLPRSVFTQNLAQILSPAKD
jgi:DNA-binding NarL/FixJ family response regulator